MSDACKSCSCRLMNICVGLRLKGVRGKSALVERRQSGRTSHRERICREEGGGSGLSRFERNCTAECKSAPSIAPFPGRANPRPPHLSPSPQLEKRDTLRTSEGGGGLVSLRL